ncbi:hypothetical protein BC830DRAFT_1128455 [Chytriomyces sp. MP71]|nr:hypothetical protein BC830DRAFT_1128455 [Chytriomyces sp. MP71]
MSEPPISHSTSIEHVSFSDYAADSSSQDLLASRDSLLSSLSISQTTLTRPASSQEVKTPTPTSSTEGLAHWERSRQQWTQGHKPYNPDADCFRDYKRNPDLEKIDVHAHFNGIYDSVVLGRRFAKPVPLNFITAVLIHGWKREGLWSERPPEPIEPTVKLDESASSDAN